MSWWSDGEPFDEHEPSWCKYCDGGDSKEECDRCCERHLKGAEDEETRPKKICTMGFQGAWCNECTQFWNCDILAGKAEKQVIEE